jgi:cytochrome c oxidase subunit 2
VRNLQKSEEIFMEKAVIPYLILFLGVTLQAGEKNETPATPNVIKIGTPAPAGAPVKDVEVSVKKYEYTPATIEVPAGTLARIHLNAVDKEHGFEIQSVKDSCVKFKPNEPATVEFYADKPGEYEFKCCKYCGFGHGKMKGKLVVKENSAAAQ